MSKKRTIVKYTLIAVSTIFIMAIIAVSTIFSTKQTRDLIVMGYVYTSTSKDLDLLHPTLKRKTLNMIAEAKKHNIDLRVISGFRSMKDQDLLYSIGRGEDYKKNVVTNARAGKSYHNYGAAVDVVEYKNGFPNWSTKNWQLIGKIGKTQGLVWGGDWKTFKDKPHFQLPKKYWADKLR